MPRGARYARVHGAHAGRRRLQYSCLVRAVPRDPNEGSTSERGCQRGYSAQCLQPRRLGRIRKEESKADETTKAAEGGRVRREGKKERRKVGEKERWEDGTNAVSYSVSPKDELSDRRAPSGLRRGKLANLHSCKLAFSLSGLGRDGPAARCECRATFLRMSF